jgi:nucleoside-diphosphate-sugar epimerase
LKTLIVGCGYVGSALGAELVRQGHQVYGLGRNKENQQQLLSLGIVPVLADLTRRETLERVPHDFNWVINCVSASGGGADDYREVYVEGNRNLVDWLKSSSIRKLVYTSSTGVYGQNDGSRVDETSLAAPENDTGKALVAAEAVLLDAAQTGFPAVVLRLAGIYGPGRGYWLKQFLAGLARIEGSGARILNMVHRDDVVGAIIAALQRGCPGEIYNVVDDEPVSQIALFEWLASSLGRALPPAVPEDAAANRKRGVTSKSVANQRLHSELGYEFRYPTFREGFAAELKHK